MTATVVRARIDERLKAEAKSILASMGLSVSDAIRLLLTRVTVDKTLPFELKAPNAVTIAAMEAARCGKDRESVETLIDLWTELEQENDSCGNSKDDREYHIKPEWLLIYRLGPDVLVRVRTGSHAELF